MLCLLMFEGLGVVFKKTKCTGVVKIKQLTKHSVKTYLFTHDSGLGQGESEVGSR